MTMSTHVAVGAAIGLAVNQPITGFALGFISHFLLDIIPHGDTKLSETHLSKDKSSLGAYTYVALDNVIAIYLLLTAINLVNKEYIWALSMGVAGSILPDVLVGIYEASKKKIAKGFYRMHLKIHNLISGKVGDIPLVVGVGYQVVAITLLLSYIKTM